MTNQATSILNSCSLLTAIVTYIMDLFTSLTNQAILDVILLCLADPGVLFRSVINNKHPSNEPEDPKPTYVCETPNKVFEESRFLGHWRLYQIYYFYSYLLTFSQTTAYAYENYVLVSHTISIFQTQTIKRPIK